MRTIGKSLPNDASSLFTQTDTTTVCTIANSVHILTRI